MKKTFVKKIVIAASAFIVMAGYCLGMGAAGYTVADAQASGIATEFYGPYYLNGDQQNSDWLNIRSLDYIVFRGYYSGRGTIAGSNIDTKTFAFAPNEYTIGAENFMFKFNSWARLVGDSFEPQLGYVEVLGSIGIDRSDGWLKKALISNRYYILKR